MTLMKLPTRRSHPQEWGWLRGTNHDNWMNFREYSWVFCLAGILQRDKTFPRMEDDHKFNDLALERGRMFTHC
jgi:hypothetical protein